jgi:uncharacterized membrane protein YgcG
MTESLLKFSQRLDGTFFVHLRSLGDTMWWGGWYGIVLLPLIIAFIVNGIRFALGDMQGDQLRSFARKFLYSLLLMGVGLVAMPGIELLSQYLKEVVSAQVGNIPKKMYDMNAEKMKAAGERISGALAEATVTGNAGDAEVSAFINQLDTHERILFDQMTLSTAKDMSKVLLPNEVDRINDMISASGAMDTQMKEALKGDVQNFKNAAAAAEKWGVYKDISPDQLMLGAAGEDVSIWRASFADLIAMLFTFIGAVFKIIILFIRGCLLFIFRTAFPIVVALSFIPTFENALKEWWDNYKTLALMLVTMIVIETLMSVSWLTSRTAADVPAAGIINALVAFVGGILYLLTPTITVMLFGGSQAMAGISQQIMTAGGLMVGSAKIATSAVYHKNQDGTTGGAVSLGVKALRNAVGTFRNSGGGSSGGGSSSNAAPIV